jgi:hypothetical protein
MLILNSFFVVPVDYPRVFFYKNSVPWQISVPGNILAWHKEVKKSHLSFLYALSFRESYFSPFFAFNLIANL